MKFSLLTYLIAKSWDFDRVLATAQRLGFAGVEFRAEMGHAHGVELEATPEERRAIRERVQDAYLEVACLSCSQRYESPDIERRTAAIDRTKRYVDLAVDIGAPRLRVCGNDIPKGVAREACVQYVAESLAQIADYAAPGGVDILLEMHGEFNNWHYSLGALKLAKRANLGILYNSDNRDLVGGSIAATFSRFRPYLRHVHLHDLASGFPYGELFQLLKTTGYDGYVSPEILVEVPTTDDYLALYVELMRTLAK